MSVVGWIAGQYTSWDKQEVGGVGGGLLHLYEAQQGIASLSREKLFLLKVEGKWK